MDPEEQRSERGASGAGAIGNHVYVVAGSRGASVAEFSRYDVNGDAWEPLAPLPAVRNHLVAGVVDGMFYAIGGRDSGTGDVKPEVWRWDGVEWTARAPMLTARGGAAAAVLDGRIYVMGGEGASTASGVFSETESYDAAGDAWRVEEPMRTPRHGTGAATVGDTIYVPGGADVEGFGAVDDVEAYTP